MENNIVKIVNAATVEELKPLSKGEQILCCQILRSLFRISHTEAGELITRIIDPMRLAAKADRLARRADKLSEQQNISTEQYLKISSEIAAVERWFRGVGRFSADSSLNAELISSKDDLLKVGDTYRKTAAELALVYYIQDFNNLLMNEISSSIFAKDI